MTKMQLFMHKISHTIIKEGKNTKQILFFDNV